MRPRLITAENVHALPRGLAGQSGFNEAAAHHRGERKMWDVVHGRPSCFNEAAAHHRGEHPAWTGPSPRRPRFNEAAAHHRGELLGDVIAIRRRGGLQ